MHIKRDDNVVVISGNDKGKKGKVLQAFPKLNKVLVEGVNMKKRHIPARRGGAKGQVVEKSMPIHASNVKLAK